MSSSDYAAWFGAVLSTLIFLYQLWRDFNNGPKVQISARSNMRLLNVPHVESDQNVISITVRNTGSSPTTIECINMHDPRERKNYYVQPLGLNPFPKLIQPGEIWNDAFIQVDEVSRIISNNGYLKISFSHKLKGIKVIIGKS